MAVAAVDTGVLIGMADADDQHHGTAMEIVRGMDHGELPTGHVTNYVALETLNWIHNRKHQQTAVETYERLNRSAGFEILHAAQKDFTNALGLFETYDRLSLGDATIVAYMQREGIEYLYSFDDDFDAVNDIARLETPNNPF
ncbi:twitching motility protein PilT (plasmid) [Haloarcula sp. CBA1115]|uniref:type II toxin-antitoxin system VapC family toxin n=1 Tax=unclassified Haloarcula TaxID=2624677 RepID=UPI0005955A8E|nr:MULTISPECIES: PIN domain-containing protein [unclassified Haloarcula]AJF28074.1 twitching motility protein PilT [Haloarcula sp. CBA1115]